VKLNVPVCAARNCARRETLSELKTVFTIAKFRHYLPDEPRRQFVQMMEKQVRLLVVRDEEYFATHSACRDSKNNKFLVLAYECEAV
jgi:putative PIN family toxin of toxin-antitoxin system